MGSTLQAPYGWNGSKPSEPEGWQPPDRATFDWNQDGRNDTLTVANDTVTVAWSGGQIMVTGVQTDYFGRPVFDDDGEVGQLTGEEGRAYGEKHIPAAVGDVTGDGYPDLIASHRGHAAVLIGEGRAAVSATVPFEDMGRTSPGWQSDPVRYPGSKLLPTPIALVSVIWDVSGDGAREFTVTRLGSGRTGPGVAYFAGVPCKLP